MGSNNESKQNVNNVQQKQKRNVEQKHRYFSTKYFQSNAENKNENLIEVLVETNDCCAQVAFQTSE